MLKIWGRTNSSNVKKVLWACEELGVAYERVDAGGAFGVVDTPAYRAMNPNGLVPVVQDGDLVLWESHTIVRWLAAKHPEGGLWLTDPDARAKVEMWMDWTHSFYHPFRDVAWGLLRTPPEKRDTAAIERGLEGCAKLWAIADASLATRPWMSGDAFGLADIVLGPYIYVWMGLPIERGATPHLDAWYARLQARPTWSKVIDIGLS
jgi:glutathione S-transferase